MTQGELTAIWDALDPGEAVSGWGRMIGGGDDEQVLREIASGEGWNRKSGTARWEKISGTAGRYPYDPKVERN